MTVRNLAVEMRKILVDPQAKITSMRVIDSKNRMLTLAHGNKTISALGQYAIGSKVLVSNGNIVGGVAGAELTLWVD